MASKPIVEALRDADAFHKNACLMFEDIVASIREQALLGTLKDLQGPEGEYGIWSSKLSQHKHLFIFEFAGRFEFVHILLKAHDDLLRGESAQYKAVCVKLEVDPIMPLLLAYGIFRPRDIQRFTGEAWLRRDWANHTILLGVPDEIRLADPNLYEWNKAVVVQSPVGTDSHYCEGATVKLRALTEIRNQNDIRALVEDLLNGMA